MDIFSFTRALIDLESITGNEEQVARYIAAFLQQSGIAAELQEVEPHRFNVYAAIGKPVVVLSTHMDTVPPFLPSREDDHNIYGRGSCDAKGIIAAQVFASLELLQSGVKDFALLFMVGEERNSTGALWANQRPVGSRYLINGEPTESQMVEAGKGALRVDLRAEGRMAHSAYPHLGESAIEKLLEALARLRAMDLPAHPRLGPTTFNIGVIAGGRAPNVIPDQAHAEILYRLVEPAADLRRRIEETVAGLATPHFQLEIAPVFPLVLPGFQTTLVSFTTDIPALSQWGTPILFGPGSIHVAHTDHEFIAKAELQSAVHAYAEMVRKLHAMDAEAGASQ